MLSTVFVLSYMGRAVVAASFFLSSGWKAIHPGEFSDAYRRIGRIGSRLFDFSGWIGWVVAVVEIIVGCSVLLTGVPRVVVVLPSLFSLAVLSLALLLAPDLQGGCGCWTKPPSTPPRRVYLSRNLILALLALTGLASGPDDSINFGVIALSLIVGGLISFALMELPEIRSVWLAGRPSTGEMTS
ncbi:MAG: hypothetical protein J2P27_03640 [Actinobacteria bacterium]|nr:hypothetical protein [Actinomycetota bacterium]